MKMQELLKSRRIEYVEAGNQHCRPGWIQLAVCPFCGSIKYHLGYNLRGGYFNCWKCGGHHTISVLTRLGFGHEEAREFWKGRELPGRPEGRRSQGLVEPRHQEQLLPPHRHYLESRGFDPDTIARMWQVGSIGLDVPLSWRLYIPILLDGVRVSWTTRAIGSGITQRYLSAGPEQEALPHKHLIYGADYCSHAIIIVEGPTDAWRIGPGAGALFGTAYSTAQVRRLLHYPFRFVCFDSAPEAQRQAVELAEQLAVFPGETHNILIDAKDPGVATPREIRRLRRAARLD